MAIFVYDGRRCPALFLSGANPDGSPLRAVYWYYSTEGNGKIEQRETASLFAAPADNGASWSVANPPSAQQHGAIPYVIVPDDANLNEVSNRLVATKGNYDRVMGELAGGPIHGEAEAGVGDMFQTPATELTADTRPRWEQLGYPSKQAWKDAGRP